MPAEGTLHVDIGGSAYPTPPPEGGRLSLKECGGGYCLTYWPHRFPDRSSALEYNGDLASMNDQYAPLNIYQWPWTHYSAGIASLKDTGASVGVSAVQGTTFGYLGFPRFEPPAGYVALEHGSKQSFFNTSGSPVTFGNTYRSGFRFSFLEDFTEDVLVPGSADISWAHTLGKADLESELQVETVSSWGGEIDWRSVEVAEWLSHNGSYSEEPLAHMYSWSLNPAGAGVRMLANAVWLNFRYDSYPFPSGIPDEALAEFDDESLETYAPRWRKAGVPNPEGGTLAVQNTLDGTWHICDNREDPPPGGTAGDGGAPTGWYHASWMRSKDGGPGSGRTGRLVVEIPD